MLARMSMIITAATAAITTARMPLAWIQAGRSDQGTGISNLIDDLWRTAGLLVSPPCARSGNVDPHDNVATHYGGRIAPEDFSGGIEGNNRSSGN